MPIEQLILILTATFVVAQLMVMALSGPVRRDQRNRSPQLLGELKVLVIAIVAVARPRPIFLKIRSSRAPPTFPMQPVDLGPAA